MMFRRGSLADSSNKLELPSRRRSSVTAGRRGSGSDAGLGLSRSKDIDNNKKDSVPKFQKECIPKAPAPSITMAARRHSDAIQACPLTERAISPVGREGPDTEAPISYPWKSSALPDLVIATNDRKRRASERIIADEHFPEETERLALMMRMMSALDRREVSDSSPPLSSYEQIILRRKSMHQVGVKYTRPPCCYTEPGKWSLPDY